eukprot:TRINITY_DN695_c0_g1_i3.p1 TRINITY_DN695_c0_g1~~TRINITY_DN695_c0_g1_i3.p1  ORF type:complete len:491 (-),score=75.50 TRINITY_DN695_c0_g1_i3:162-1634(-)
MVPSVITFAAFFTLCILIPGCYSEDLKAIGNWKLLKGIRTMFQNEAYFNSKGGRAYATMKDLNYYPPRYNNLVLHLHSKDTYDSLVYLVTLGDLKANNMVKAVRYFQLYDNTHLGKKPLFSNVCNKLEIFATGSEDDDLVLTMECKDSNNPFLVETRLNFEGTFSWGIITYVIAQVIACSIILITNRTNVALFSRIPRLCYKASIGSVMLATFWDTFMIFFHSYQLSPFQRPLLFIVSALYLAIFIFDLIFVKDVIKGRTQQGYRFPCSADCFRLSVMIFLVFQVSLIGVFMNYLREVMKILMFAPFFIIQIADSLYTKGAPITNKRYLYGFYLPRVFTLVYFHGIPHNIYDIEVLPSNIVILVVSMVVQYGAIYLLSSRKKRKVVDEEKKEEVDVDCAICLDPLSNDGLDVEHENPAIRECLTQVAEISKTQCNHYFHKDCITAWMNKMGDKPSCPVCRAELPKQPQSQIFLVSLRVVNSFYHSSGFYS